MHDKTAETGITFHHTDGASGHYYIVEGVAAGLALFDYDNDGDLDIYFLNGAPLPGATADKPPRNHLYRNDGNWHFTDVTEEAGVGDTGYGLGVTAADYDNDGDQDLYLNNFGPNVLYRNNGDRTFTEVTEAAGVGNGSRVGAGTCFLDIDHDGDLDLYVANYVNFSCDRNVTVTVAGFPRYPSPAVYGPDPDTLYRNNGDGTFTDISIESGIAAHAGTGMGMVCFDYDRDGDTDIFVCNDTYADFLFQNDGTGKFTEVGLEAGVAYNLQGRAGSSMGSDCGDYDNDGWLDLFRTDSYEDLPVLYHNLADGTFEDVTREANIGSRSFPHVNWGTAFADFDNDGYRDLFMACGHYQDNIEHTNDTTSYRAYNILLWNTGKGRFKDVTAAAGDGMQVVTCSRGAVCNDLDGDGDIDCVILNSRGIPTILENVTNNSNHWIRIRLRGVKSNRDGVGARLTVKAGKLVSVDEVHSGRGYQSHAGMWLHFGLGQHQQIDQIKVEWPSGKVDVVANLPADQSIEITEGTNKAVKFNYRR